MSDKQNLADELINMWQKQMQDYFKNPKVVELMAEQYEQYQKVFQQASQSESSSSASSDIPNHVNDELRELKEYVAELEARIKLLEKYMAKGK